MVEEQAGDEFASRAGAGFVEDRLEVVLDGVNGKVESLPDLVGGKALCNKFSDTSFAVGEAVGVGDERCEFVRTGLVDQDRHRGVCTVAEDRSPHGNPTAFRGTNTSSGERVGPRLPPVRIGLTIAGDAARPCCYGKHGNREFLTRRVTGDEISEPTMSSRSRCLDGVIRGKYHYTARRLIGCCEYIENGGAAEALRH